VYVTGEGGRFGAEELFVERWAGAAANVEDEDEDDDEEGGFCIEDGAILGEVTSLFLFGECRVQCG